MSQTVSPVNQYIPLPSKLFLPDGQELITGTEPWELCDLSRKRIRFRFGTFTALHHNTVIQIKHTIGHFLETRSILYSHTIFQRFVEFHKAVLLQAKPETILEIQLADLLNFRANLDSNTIWKMGNIRILLEAATRLGYGFCSAEALAWLDDAVIPSNPKGVGVRTRDPNRGAFTAAEVSILNAALNDAYADAEIGIVDYAAGHVLLAFGIRSRQLAALKEKDLIVAYGKDGEKRYILRIPQAKQRGELTRASFRNRPCDRRLGRLLELLIEYNANLKNDPKVPTDEWPLFINLHFGESAPGFNYHETSKDLSRRLETVIERRTGTKANTKRYRHTLGQNLADDGASKFVIAEALGHADTQSVASYVDASPELVGRLNVLTEDFLPILQAFAGKLISREEVEAQLASKGKLLHERSLATEGGEPLGHCGSYGFCDLVKPIGCYTCRSFWAWDDGPHEQMLAMLLSQRKKKIERGLSSKIYTIGDRTIAAVTRVCQLCRERRGACIDKSSPSVQ